MSSTEKPTRLRKAVTIAGVVVFIVLLWAVRFYFHIPFAPDVYP
jgi:hypothetical protein